MNIISTGLRAKLELFIIKYAFCLYNYLCVSIMNGSGCAGPDWGWVVEKVKVDRCVSQMVLLHLILLKGSM